MNKKVKGFASGVSRDEDTFVVRRIIGGNSYYNNYGDQRFVGQGTVCYAGMGQVASGPSPFVKMNPHIFQMRIGSCGGLPRVTVSKGAYVDMCCIVAEATTGEVGWVGTVKRVGMNFSIEEIFLPGQRGHAATCEITTEGLGDLATEILKRKDGVDVWNSIRFWGHVHPGNCTNPSSQDDDQMKIFRDACPDFFIRGILGREGRMEFTVFVYDCGLIFYDVPWGIEESEQDIADRRAAWKEILESTVKPLHGQTTHCYTGPYQDHNRFGTGRMIDGRWVWRGAPGWVEEEDVSVQNPVDDAVDDTSTGVTGTVIPSTPQKSSIGGFDQDLLARIKVSTTTIMRWKLWRLFRMLDAKSKEAVVSWFSEDVRKISDVALHSELSDCAVQERRWFLMSELGIREERYSLIEMTGRGTKDECFATRQFERDYVSLDRAETSLRSPGYKESPEKQRVALATFREKLVIYVQGLGIDLGMDKRELSRSTSSVTPSLKEDGE